MKKSIIILFFIFAQACWAQQWEECNNGLYRGGASSIILSNNQILVGTGSGVYITTNNGINWKRPKDGLADYTITFLAEKNNYIYAGTTTGGVFISSDNGNSWTGKNNGLTTMYVLSFATCGNTLYVGTFTGVFVSTNKGNSWSAKNLGLEDLTIHSLVSDNNYVYAGTDYNGVFKTDNYSNGWTSVNKGISILMIYELAIDGQNLLARTSSSGLFFTTNGGNTWSEITDNTLKFGINSISFVDGIIYAGVNGNIYISKDNGVSFTPFDTNFNEPILAVKGNGSYLVALTSNKIYTSTDLGATWINQNTALSDMDVNSIAMENEHIVISTAKGIFESIDNGQSWRSINNNFYGVVALANNKIFAGCGSGTLTTSTDNGTTWIKSDSGISTSCIYKIKIYNNSIYLGTENWLYCSTDNGSSWVISNKNKGGFKINDLILIDSNIFITTNYGGTILSTDLGTTWVNKNKGIINVTNNEFVAIANDANDKALYLATVNEQFYVSTDFGENWLNRSNGFPETGTAFSQIEVIGNSVFVATIDGVFVSTDKGENWVSKSIGIDSVYDRPWINSISHNKDYVFVGTFGSGIYRAKLSDFGIVGIEDKPQDKIQSDITIFPNPAKDILIIKTQNIYPHNKVIIYNFLGVKQLECKSLEQNTIINIESLSRGVYFIKVGNETKMFVKN